MSIVAQEVTKDFVSITFVDGRSIVYTSADAQKAGSAEAARLDFQSRLADFAELIDARSVYVEIDGSFSFRSLERVSASQDAPPPIRDVVIEKTGDITVMAFDGRKETIAAVDIKAAPDADQYLKDSMAAIGYSVDSKYDVVVTKDGKGDVTGISVDDIAVVAVAADAEVIP